MHTLLQQVFYLIIKAEDTNMDKGKREKQNAYKNKSS